MARITMPQLGETVTEGTVTRWLKQPGDQIELDEPLLEVSTDKVETEIPSAHAGVLARVVVAEGTTVPIGALLAVVGDDDTPDEGADLGPGAADLHDDYQVRARHREVRGFRRAMEGGAGSTQPPLRPRPARSPRSAPPPPSGAPPATTAPTTAMGSAAPIDTRNVARRIPFSTIRRRTAEHLTASIRTAAHTLTVVEVDYRGVESARDHWQAAWRQHEGFGLSYLPFIARAVCDTLAEFPLLNASVDVDDLVVHRAVNLGVAVDLDHEGLIVPVVADAGSLRLGELARRVRELAGRAHTRTLTGDDTAGGTFTITNAGGFGTFLTAPLINPPQVAILSTDGVSMRPVAVALPEGGHGVAVHPTGNLALSFDHRAVDGAYASGFLDSVRRALQQRDWTTEVAEIGLDATTRDADRPDDAWGEWATGSDA